MKSFLSFLIFFTLFFAFTAPAAVLAADGCSSVGPTCTINGNPGSCAQNDIGDFYCRPTVLNQSSNSGSGFTALAPIPGLTDAANTSVVNSDSLARFFNNLYKYAIGLAAVLAIIMIIWGGLEISTKDSVSKQSDGKERIYQAILGLVLVLSPALVFSIINPAILNLSVNLPALDTKSVPINTTSATQDAQPPVADSTNLRGAQGVQTMGGFTLSSTLTLPQVRQALNEKQAECSQKSDQLGFIMPPLPGTNVYTCQTCPPGTTLRLQSARDAITPLGSCVQN